MGDKLLLNPDRFVFWDHLCEDERKGDEACKRLQYKWTPALETQMLQAFIRFYYDYRYRQWGSDDEEQSKAHWPKIKTPADFIAYTGAHAALYALEDGVYAKGEGGYVSQQVDLCVILSLNCPWENDYSWGAVFIDEKFVKVGKDIVDRVLLD